MNFILKFWDGFVNLALVNAFGIYIASKFFFVIKAWVLHRHFALSVPISWRQIGYLVSLCWVWVSSGMFHAGFSMYFFEWWRQVGYLVSLCWVWVSSGMFYAGFSIYFFTWFCEFGTSKCFWDLHSVKVFFSVIKAWVLHRHFAHSVPISWRKIHSLASSCWVWVSSGMFYAWFMYFILIFFRCFCEFGTIAFGICIAFLWIWH